ncbi:hypothetical protein KRX57_04685 [Weeksellaceae bacterium TAE3-ERU29]|nr:hypothetical protein [Weeksellaceae bacterium TAE3-ERU29]
MKYLIFYILVSFCLFSCDKISKEKRIKEKTSSYHKEISAPNSKQKSILSPLFQKYKKSKYFEFIIKEHKDLEFDILQNIQDEGGNIVYKEEKLDTNLFLSNFSLNKAIEYNFFIEDNQIILKTINSIDKTNINFEYKDWDNNKEKEILQYIEECSAGCLSFSKQMIIYHIKKDTAQRFISLPLKKVDCYGNISHIIIYDYKKNGNILNITKTVGKGDCNSNIIEKIDSVYNSKILLSNDNYGQAFFDF